MAQERMGMVLQYIRRTVGAHDVSADADLLDRFATQREEAAFTALLQRHGPMVLSVCRRVLDNAADADDALQATFLVLVRRAGSIRKRTSVASWLHGVALRVAREARARAARRRAHEQRAEVVVQPESPSAEATRELRAILDEELEQLPAKYRSPLVLHYFEGKTKDETARQLGWSEGTVSGRLARARDLLRNRLGRRGLMLAGGMLAAALAKEEAVLAMPVVLTESTLKAATLFAAGEVAVGASAARIAALTERVVHTMFLTKLKIATAALLLAVAVGLGGGGLIVWAQAKQPTDAPEQAAPGVHFPTEAAALAKDQRLPALKKIDPEGAKKAGDDNADLSAKKRTAQPLSAQEPKLRDTLKTEDYVFSVAFSPDGKTMATVSFSKDIPPPADPKVTVRLWDVASGKTTATFQRPRCVVVFNPQSKAVAVKSSGLTIKVWDLASGKSIATIKGETEHSFGAVSSDFKTLATLGGHGNIWLWDVASGKNTLFRIHDPEVGSAAFSPDGKTLATGGYSGLLLWDVASGKNTVTTLPDCGFGSVAFSPDGKTVAKVRGDVTIKLWDVASGKNTATFKADTSLVCCVAFSPDGKTLATTSKDGIKLWNMATGNKADKPLPGKDKADLSGKKLNAGVVRDEPTAAELAAENVALKAVKALGGRITVDAEQPGLPVVAVDFSKTQITDADLKLLKAFKRLESLNLYETRVTVPGLAALKEFKRLNTLTLDYREATGLKTDAVLKALREIGLLYALAQAESKGGKRPSGPAEVVAFSGLGGLGRLPGHPKEMTDAGLKELKVFTNLESLSLDGLLITDAGMKEIAGLTSLQTLGLNLTKVTDVGLKELVGLKNLQTLNVMLTPVTDAGMKHVNKLTNLQTLGLSLTAVSAAGLKELRDLKRLHTLILTDPFPGGGRQSGITDATLKTLREIGMLHALDSATAKDGKRPSAIAEVIKLDLVRAQVTDAGLAELRELKNLESLELAETKVTDAGLAQLKQFPRLQTLSLWGTAVTDAGIARLKDLPRLQTLGLVKTKVTDAGLKDLPGFATLKSLDVSYSAVTAAGVKQLEEARPKLIVTRK